MPLLAGWPTVGLLAGGSCGVLVWLSLGRVLRTGLWSASWDTAPRASASRRAQTETARLAFMGFMAFTSKNECKNAWGVRCNSPPEKLLHQTHFCGASCGGRKDITKVTVQKALFWANLKHHM